MTSTYRALVCERLTDDLSGLALRELPVTAPGPGEIAIRVRAAALNFPDLLTCAGRYQHKAEPPFVPGMEGAGEVVAVGEGVDDWRLGERAVFGAKTGAFAERVVVPREAVQRMSARLDFVHAAAIRVAALTAYVSLVRRGDLHANEWLLVHGAAGGTGMAAVQLGLHLGARVIAVAASDEKLAALRELGATQVVDARGDIRAAVKAITGGRGADVVFDPVGGRAFDESLHCIAWGGRLLVVGFASGRIPTVSVNLPLIKGFSIVGVRAGEYGRRDPVRGAENLREVARLVELGVFDPRVSARYPLERAVDALRAMGERRVIGKAVIEP